MINAPLSIPVMMGNFLSTGRITTRAKEGLTLGQYNDLPALYGDFSLAHFDLSPGALMGLGYGKLYRDGPSPLTFRFQVGTSQLYWLVDPREPEVWDMLDAWSHAKRMVCLINVNGQTGVISRDYPRIPPEIEEQRQYVNKPDARFAPELMAIIASGQLAACATSDLPQVPRLEHVEMCLVPTPKLKEELELMGMPIIQVPVSDSR